MNETKMTGRRNFCLLSGSLLLTACTGTEKRESTGEFIDDTTITAKVKAVFVESEAISVFDVGVTTFKGRVQLSGFVDTPAQREEAAKLASQVSGVTLVENNISVK